MPTGRSRVVFQRLPPFPHSYRKTEMCRVLLLASRLLWHDINPTAICEHVCGGEGVVQTKFTTQQHVVSTSPFTVVYIPLLLVVLDAGAMTLNKGVDKALAVVGSNAFGCWLDKTRSNDLLPIRSKLTGGHLGLGACSHAFRTP